MTNDEIRMTKETRSQKNQRRGNETRTVSSFEFGHSFVIRHLSFVIRSWPALAAVLLLAGCVTDHSAPDSPEGKLEYPVTRKTNTVDDYSGVKIADPYRWLEDDNSSET